MLTRRSQQAEQHDLPVAPPQSYGATSTVESRDLGSRMRRLHPARHFHDGGRSTSFGRSSTTSISARRKGVTLDIRFNPGREALNAYDIILAIDEAVEASIWKSITICRPTDPRAMNQNGHSRRPRSSNLGKGRGIQDRSWS